MHLMIGSFFAISVLLAGCQENGDSPNVSNTPSVPNPQPEDSPEQPNRVPSQTKNKSYAENKTSGRPLEEPSETAPADKVIQESQEALDAAGQFAAKTKDEYVAKLSDQMKKLDKKIDDLKAKGEKLQGQAKTEWRDQMEALRIKRQQADQLLDELKAASGKSWEDFREGTTNAWQDLKTSIDAAAKRFTSQDSKTGEKSPNDSSKEPSSEKSRSSKNAPPK